jgi:hypothetical protein
MRADAVPRPALHAALLERAGAGVPFLLAGPAGSGKTTLLGELARALREAGREVVRIDLFGAASSPEQLLASIAGALPPGPQAEAARAARDRGRAGGPEAIREAFIALAGAGDGRPAALLLDEATEIRSLAYFDGLREVHALLGQCLLGRAGPTVLTTSYPTLAATLWPGLSQVEVPPLEAADLAGRFPDPARLAAATGGRPAYLSHLGWRLRTGESLETALAAELAEGSGLERACRAAFEVLLLRSRGYGMSKAVLKELAAEEGLNLTALAERLGRSPGAVRDYLGWLLAVDVLRSSGKRWYFVDPLLRIWVRLHGSGRPAGPREVAAETAALLGCGPLPETAAAPAPRRARRDELMEID